MTSYDRSYSGGLFGWVSGRALFVRERWPGAPFLRGLCALVDVIVFVTGCSCRLGELYYLAELVEHYVVATSGWP